MKYGLYFVLKGASASEFTKIEVFVEASFNGLPNYVA